MDCVRVNQKTAASLEEAIDEALNELEDESPVKAFLIANKAEVKNMCITEYDEERTLAELREEYLEEGLKKGIQQGMEKGMEKGMQQGMQQGMRRKAKKRENSICWRNWCRTVC